MLELILMLMTFALVGLWAVGASYQDQPRGVEEPDQKQERKSRNRRFNRTVFAVFFSIPAFLTLTSLYIE